MANLTLHKARLSGTVAVPPSKSITHRALIASALSGGTISPIEESEDILATKDCLLALLEGNRQFKCRESGTTLRLMIPLAMALCGGGTFFRDGGLQDRPVSVYSQLFPYASFSKGEPLSVFGALRPLAYTMRGDVSSQFISGLLLALPLLDGDSEIHIIGPFESASYVELTLDVMGTYGVGIDRPSPSDFFIKGNQAYQACDFTVEGDYSQAAVFLAANALGHKVTLTGLNPDSKQGDRAMVDIISSNAQTIDASQCPDIIPIVALLRCLTPGHTVIENAARLRLKECDRLAATVSLLNTLGASIREAGDTMVIDGVPSLKGGATVSCQNDHRMAMMLSIAALSCDEPITLSGVECVKKSWPDYFDVYRRLGGIAK